MNCMNYLKLARSATSSLPRLASINLIVVEVSAKSSSYEGKAFFREISRPLVANHNQIQINH